MICKTPEMTWLSTSTDIFPGGNSLHTQSPVYEVHHVQCNPIQQPCSKSYFYEAFNVHKCRFSLTWVTKYIKFLSKVFGHRQPSRTVPTLLGRDSPSVWNPARGIDTNLPKNTAIIWCFDHLYVVILEAVVYGAVELYCIILKDVSNISLSILHNTVQPQHKLYYPKWPQRWVNTLDSLYKLHSCRTVVLDYTGCSYLIYWHLSFDSLHYWIINVSSYKTGGTLFNWDPFHSLELSRYSTRLFNLDLL